MKNFTSIYDFNITKSQEKLIYLLISLAFFNGISETLIGPLTPLISSDLKINLSLIGLIISINTLCILVSSILAGILIQKFGHKIFLIIGSLLSILGALGLYLSPNFYFFIIFCTVLGLGAGIISTCILSYICDLFPNNKSSQLLKLNTGWLFGVLASPILVSIMTWSGFLWKNLFLFLSLAQIPILLTIILSKFKKILKTEITKIKSNIFLIKKFFNFHFFLSLLIIFISSAVTKTFSFWFTTYFSSINIDLKFSSIFLIIYTASTIMGMYLKRFLLKSYPEKKIMMFNSIISAISLFLAFITPNIILKLIFIIIFGINIIGFISITISIETQLRPRYSAPIVGVFNGISSLSVIISQYLTGFLSERFTKSSVLYVDLVLLVLLCILLIFFYFFDKLKNFSSNIR